MHLNISAAAAAAAEAEAAAAAAAAVLSRAQFENYSQVDAGSAATFASYYLLHCYTATLKLLSNHGEQKI